MSVSILIVDDEPDVADLFRQRFRRETRQGTYVMQGSGAVPQGRDRTSRRLRGSRPRAALLTASELPRYGEFRFGAPQTR
jgi:CheY-like chemotaxis protein